MNNRDACLAFVRLLLTALLIAIMVPALDASPAAAQQDRGAICMWQTVTGTIDDSNPEDHWHFDASAGDLITVRMMATEDSSLDPYVRLIDDASGREIAAAQRYLLAVRISSIYNVRLPSTGRYTIVATRYSNSGPGISGGYTLSVEEGIPSDVFAADAESQDLHVGGGRIFAGERVVGALDNSNSSDRWYFLGRSGDQLTATPETGGSLRVNLRVVQAGAQQPLVSVDRWGSFPLQYVIPQNAWYYVKVEQREGNQAGPYQLTFTGSGGQRSQVTECVGSGPVAASAPSETIDISTPPYEQLSVEQSAAILNNQPSMESAIATGSPIVPFVFAANEGDAIMIRMMRTSGNLIPLLGVQDMAGLLDRASADLSGRQATLSLTIPETGWYAVLATREGAEEGTTTGDFLLTFEGSTVEGGGPPDIGQPAVAATAGQTFEDEITEEDFVFYYLINVADGQGLVITMRRADGNLEPFVAIMDTELNVLLRGRPNLAGTESALAFKPEEGGWYVIAATRADFDAGTTTGVYTLDVQSQ